MGQRRKRPLLYFSRQSQAMVSDPTVRKMGDCLGCGGDPGVQWGAPSAEEGQWQNVIRTGVQIPYGESRDKETGTL
jgi:hypothetical protein